MSIPFDPLLQAMLCCRLYLLLPLRTPRYPHPTSPAARSPRHMGRGGTLPFGPGDVGRTRPFPFICDGCEGFQAASSTSRPPVVQPRAGSPTDSALLTDRRHAPAPPRLSSRQAPSRPPPGPPPGSGQGRSSPRRGSGGLSVPQPAPAAAAAIGRGGAEEEVAPRREPAAVKGCAGGGPSPAERAAAEEDEGRRAAVGRAVGPAAPAGKGCAVLAAGGAGARLPARAGEGWRQGRGWRRGRPGGSLCPPGPLPRGPRPRISRVLRPDRCVPPSPNASAAARLWSASRGRARPPLPGSAGRARAPVRPWRVWVTNLPGAG